MSHTKKREHWRHRRYVSMFFFSTKLYREQIESYLTGLGYSKLVQGWFEKMSFFGDPLETWTHTAAVVPIHVHAKVVHSILVNGTFVVFGENSCKMFSVLPPNVLGAKVVNTESEWDRLRFMFQRAWCDLALLVAVLVEFFFSEILCKDARLRETVHALYILT